MKRFTAEQAVAVAAPLLDRTWPDWFEVVDPATLNINEGCRCVAGQYANAKRLSDYELRPFSAGLDALVETPEFQALSNDDRQLVLEALMAGEGRIGVKELDKAWRAAIEARRQAVTA